MALVLVDVLANAALDWLVKNGTAPSGSGVQVSHVSVFNAADAGLTAVAATWGAVSAGKAAGSTSSFSISAAGPVTYARFTGTATTYTRSEALTVGTAGSGADIIMTSLAASTSSTITDCSVGVLSGSGTIGANVALRDVLTKLILGKTLASNERLVVTTGTSVPYRAKVNLYSGTAPSSADDAATGTLLWTADLLDTNLNTVANGETGLTASLTANAVATGTVGYMRITRDNATTVYTLQLAVATDTSADAQLSTLSAVSGNALSVTALVLALN